MNRKSQLAFGIALLLLVAFAVATEIALIATGTTIGASIGAFILGALAASTLGAWDS